MRLPSLVLYVHVFYTGTIAIRIFGLAFYEYISVLGYEYPIALTLIKLIANPTKLYTIDLPYTVVPVRLDRAVVYQLVYPPASSYLSFCLALYLYVIAKMQPTWYYYCGILYY